MEAPLLVVVIMVKNEAKAIENTLLPFVNGGVTHVCVFDTGSTDATIEVTKTFFETHNIHGFIDAEPFVDFATSRNRALELAENHFPNATFFIMVDADWYIQNIHRLLEFCEEHKSKTEEIYYINVMLRHLSYASPRLMRVSAQNRYVGPVHEIPERSPTTTVYDEVHFLHTLTNENERRSKSRYKKDEEILLRELEKNPTHPRNLFYLAQTYECLEDFNNAYKFYQKRSRVQGWVEEDYVTLYRLGYIAENLCQVDDAITWHTAQDYYLKAFAIRPQRIESLVRIANHYLRSNPYVSFVYAKHACSVPCPKDQLFIPMEVYNFMRFDILSVTAWYMGEYELGKEATELALQFSPNSELLKQKLVIYESQLAKVAVPASALIAQVTASDNIRI